MNTKQYLKQFFEEKVIPYDLFEVVDGGEVHWIDNETVIELIKEAPVNEQKQIADVLRKIDFYNGNVNDFLKHLAEAFVKTQNASQRHPEGMKN